MKQTTTRFYHWALQKASAKKAPLWIGLLFFLEIFLFIPLDALMMFFCIQQKRNIFLYVVIATIASTLSGLVGYLAGHFLWDLIGPYIVPHLIAATTFDRFTTHLQTYECWAIFFGSAFPFPLKVLSLASGVFDLGVLPFALCLFIARIIRFSLIGSAMALWGNKVKTFMDRHFHRIFMVLGAKFALVLLFFWAMAR